MHTTANAVPYYNTPDCTPTWIDDKEEATSRISHTVACFALTNQNGKTVTQADVKGKYHIADFFFTSCTSICPLITHQMKVIQDSILNDHDVVLLSYSVTPWIDSVAKLKEYADNVGVHADKWHLLTGDKSAIYSLARQSYFAEEAAGYSKDSSEFLHTEHFILVDRTGRLRGIYNGTLPLETERLLADLKTLEAKD